MGKISQFEDLEVWKVSMDLCTDVYSITNLPEFSKDYGLKDQIRRSSISVPSNISEGFERDSNKQFIYFLKIAKGSCGELRTQLVLAYRLNYINQETLNALREKCIETEKQIGGFINYLKKSLSTKNS